MAAACEGGGDGDRERGAASLHRRRQQGGRGQVQADLRSVRDPRWRVHRSGIVSLAHGWIQRQGSTRCELATEMVRVTRPPRQLRQDGAAALAHKEWRSGRGCCSRTRGVVQRTRMLLLLPARVVLVWSSRAGP